MSDIVRITVRPHVKKYLVHHFGETLMINDHNYPAILLRALFQPFDKVDPALVRPSLKESLGEFYDIAMGETGLRRYGGYLSNDQIKGFDKAIDLLIKQEMYRWCQHPNRKDEVVDFNIKRFRVYYDFQDEDLTFDNLKRWYYREGERVRKREENETKIVPQLILLLYLSYEKKSDQYLILPPENPQLSLFMA